MGIVYKFLSAAIGIAILFIGCCSMHLKILAVKESVGLCLLGITYAAVSIVIFKTK